MTLNVSEYIPLLHTALSPAVVPPHFLSYQAICSPILYTHSSSLFPFISTLNFSCQIAHLKTHHLYSPHPKSPKMPTKTEIPARQGIAIPLPKGKTIKVINTHGTQVIDTWAFTVSQNKITTQMSNQHTRASLNRTIPKIGDGLFNNKREKMLTMTEDTTKGHHDTLIAACDEERYLELAGEEGRGHRNCSDNLGEGLVAIGEFEGIFFGLGMVKGWKAQMEGPGRAFPSSSRDVARVGGGRSDF